MVMWVDAEMCGIRRWVRGFLGLLTFCRFSRFGNTAYELNKTVAVSFWRDSRDLGFGVHQAFHEMLHAFDERILAMVSLR
jgi:hypothetical protein